ncbi:hypothetical protein [Bacillus dakarensis]|uniref:hypothetical protein n=1 Tax=Robertmurraya dakarensis TaxID=1926278 RepID=UPI0009814ECD|nr:hypothetical protein [Bacillus dakarensis]
MKLKVIASLSIFILLFSLAWVINNKDNREFYDPMAVAEEEEIVEIVPINYQVGNTGKKRYEIFKSREYVRIEGL